ncbi:DUF6145 family protein [[Clostridium] polysaccharolyticum]|jgi:hypothetical protein|uniref:Uncharacterized protein n=1 Tax=[Clostridium] polysaccharolyticum TaxID=29364 RepID=A0A1H9Z6A0_9FIRM|nr:DUF6145 family protein [[Clostridium] polysaccharolyticum]SES77091.1 hypothetical protein SAMN04487772_10320 [[Clostridium] polysaccharolyticum]
MDLENRVLCASSAYEEKYYFNEFYSGIPTAIQEELQIMCVTFTSEVGGILSLEYDEEGNLSLSVAADEGDLLYDEIGSGLKIKEMQRNKNELFEALETYYKVFILKQDLSSLIEED